MNTYQQKQEAKRQRLLDAADRADQKANEAWDRADLREEKSGIPLGQPILVGHHSEKRHRKALKRSDNAMRQGAEHSKRAAELRGKAEAVGKGGISSDDPDAIEALTYKLNLLTEAQDRMKKANAVIRRHVKKGVTEETAGAEFDAFAEELAKLGDAFSPEVARELLKPAWGQAGPRGFAPYKLTNNLATIKATKARIETLKKQRSAVDIVLKIEGFGTFKKNIEANRFQFIFDQKPDAETRTALKSHGYKWAPSQNAWQRQITANALYATRALFAALDLGSVPTA